MNYKVGDKVKWLNNPYTIVEITKKGVILKQNFSIGVTLIQPVNLNEINLI